MIGRIFVLDRPTSTVDAMDVWCALSGESVSCLALSAVHSTVEGSEGIRSPAVTDMNVSISMSMSMSTEMNVEMNVEVNVEMDTEVNLAMKTAEWG